MSRAPGEEEAGGEVHNGDVCPWSPFCHAAGSWHARVPPSMPSEAHAAVTAACRTQLDTQYFLAETLGEGAYGVVYKAVWLQHPAAHKVAMIVASGRVPDGPTVAAVDPEALVALKKLQRTDDSPCFLYREVSALQKIRAAQDHFAVTLSTAGPNSPRAKALHGSRYCLRLLDVERRQSTKPSLVTELCSTNVAAITDALPARRLPLCCVRAFTRQLLQALAFLHDGLGMLHRDCKPENMLLKLVPVASAAGPSAAAAGRPQGPHHRASSDPDDDMSWDHVVADAASPQQHLEDANTTHLTVSPPHRDPASPWTEPRAAGGQSSCDLSGFAGLDESEGCAANRRPSLREDPVHGAAATNHSLRWQDNSSPTSQPRLRPLESPIVVRCRICGCRPMPFDDSAVTTAADCPPSLAALIPELADGAFARGVVCLEVRLADFGSSRPVGPQPKTASHLASQCGLRDADADDENQPLLPRGCYPPCTAATNGSRNLFDRRCEPHTSAPLQYLPPDLVSPLPPVRDRYPMAIPKIHRPRVTHGWTTLPYRSPEDLLADNRRLQDVNAPQDTATAPRHGTSVDVWSAGCIFGELLLGRPLFPCPYSNRTWCPLILDIFAAIGSPASSRAAECDDAARDGGARLCTSARCWPGVSLAAGRFCVRECDSGTGAANTRHSYDAKDPRWFGALFGDCSGSGLAAIVSDEVVRVNGRGRGVIRTFLGERLAAVDRGTFAERYAVDLGQVGCASITPDTSPAADWLSRLLLLDPSRRITAREALLHPLMQDHDERR